MMRFDIIQNDITNMSVDAIVLPANEKLKEGSGTSKAIFEKAGRKALTKACQELKSCRIGEAVPTLAFNLNANYIIHAVVPKWIDGNHQEYDYLSAAYLSALTVADILNCESIAFPLLAAGNNGFDLSLAYEIAKNSIESFEGTSLNHVVLVVYGDTIATFLKGKGAIISNEQSLNSPHEIETVNKTRFQQLKEEGKQVVAEILEDQLAKAIEFLKDESNREKILRTAVLIVQAILGLPKKKGK